MNKDVVKSEKVDFAQFNQVEAPRLPHLLPYIPNSGKKDYYIDLSVFYPDVECLLDVNGVGLFARGDVQAIKGKAKQGKSFFIVAVVTALLKGSYGALKAKSDDCKVLLIDTEQNRRNVARNVRKIHRLCGWSECEDNPRLQVLTLRKKGIDLRRNIVEEEIAAFQPDLVMLDGIKDICRDFLKNEESSDVVNMLMELSEEYNTAICCVLHENKSKADNSMRGHLGAELVNKCSEEYQVTKLINTINIEQTECRNSPLREGLNFSIDENGLPTEVACNEIVVATPKEKVSIWLALFDGNPSLSLNELCRKIIAKNHIKESSAYAKIRKAIEANELLKDDEGNIMLKTVDAP